MKHSEEENLHSDSDSDDNISPEESFLDRLEGEFDWNLIGIVSIWLFLFATAFLIL